MVSQPRRGDIKFIRKFMITFGIVSWIFDYMTFGLLLMLDVSTEQFRSAWFLESVVSAAMIVFVVRSSGPFLKALASDYIKQRISEK
jgi:Mg2+-importing ATPase